MADERLRTKLELKRFVATNIKRKGMTDDMLSILIDVLWRDPYTMRTSGFYEPGGTDAIIDFDDTTLIFSIEPFDPLVENFVPRFGFFSWAGRAVYHRKYEKEEIELPDEEGLFAIYYGLNTETREQQLYYIKNPTDKEIEKLYTKQVIISFIYWDATNEVVRAFGDDRHGSQWNPQHHFYQNISFHAQRYAGMHIVNMEVNEDGSLDSHARFNVTEGQMWHDDFILDRPQVPYGSGIPILFSLAGAPRFTYNSTYGFASSGSRIAFNPSGGIATVDTENFVCYHIFATNEHKANSNKIISAMGTAQYTTLGAAYYGIDAELDAIYDYIPYKGHCLLGTIIFQTDDNYTNTPHTRIVGFSGSKSHPPVTIADDSKDILAITEEQELSFSGNISTLTEKSVTGTGAEADKIKLVNDEETPANDYYYGTDEAGSKGFHELPSEAVQALTGLTPTFDLSLGRGAKITLTGDTTITFSNLVENDTGHIEVLQDNVGGHTLSFAGTTINIAENSYKASTEVELTSIANSKDVIAYWYTGLAMNIAVIKNLLI